MQGPIFCWKPGSCGSWKPIEGLQLEITSGQLQHGSALDKLDTLEFDPEGQD